MTVFTYIRAADLKPEDPGRGVILDVRTPMEHAEKRMGLAHEHVPLDELDPAQFMNSLGLGADAEICILCRSGKRAAQAAGKFTAAGYSNVKVVEGGITACENCGHDIKGHEPNNTSGCAIGKFPVSLERQVRIVAGAVTALGALLGLFVHPLYSIIPLFVGGGLVFAGVTDRCGMALILTKAPWNSVDKL
jgi:rhodanese-related sulfurtransferase